MLDQAYLRFLHGEDWDAFGQGSEHYSPVEEEGHQRGRGVIG